MISSYPFELKQLDEAGLFTGMASTYSTEDLTGDIIEPGAFQKTLQAGNTKPLLLQHRDAVGTVTLSDSPQGLVAAGKLAMGASSARDAYELLKAGALPALSIGFTVVKDRIEGSVRRLLEVRLWEVSLVPVGANPDARVTQVKNLDEVRHALASFRSDFEREISRVR